VGNVQSRRVQQDNVNERQRAAQTDTARRSRNSGAQSSYLGHSNGAAAKVRVVVETGSQLDSVRRLTIPSQQREDVVFVTRSRLNDERQIRGQRSVVDAASELFVRVGRNEPIGQTTGAFVHLAVLIGAVHDLHAGGDGFGLRLGVRDADQVTVGEIAL
jgi:hypothetical protein